MKSNSHISNADVCHGNESCNHTVVREIDQTLDEIKFENSIYDACVIGDLEKVRLLTNKHGSSILKEQDIFGKHLQNQTELLILWQDCGIFLQDKEMRKI